MDKNIEYYLNNKQTACIEPANKNSCLSKQNYLSEFITEKDKEIARYNLGLTEKFKELKQLLDAKVIEYNGHPFDLEPTEGNYNNIVSSGNLYEVLLKYVLKSDLENWKAEVWRWIQEYINDAIQEDLELFRNKYNYLENLFRDLYNNKYYNLEEEFRELRQMFESYVSTSEGGIAISDRFGDSNNVTVSLKTITDAITNLQSKLSDYIGEPLDQVFITITPDYFISENECEAKVTVKTKLGIFESIKIFANDNLIIEETNVSNYELELTLDSTTLIKVEATIFGKYYLEVKTITKYYPFFIGGGKNLQDTIVPTNAIQNTESILGTYLISVNQNDRIYIIIPKTRLNEVGSITMGGFDIPFDIVEEDTYVVYVSKNQYKAGNYYIHII